jgi:hypothetical protein
MKQGWIGYETQSPPVFVCLPGIEEHYTLYMKVIGVLCSFAVVFVIVEREMERSL